MTGIATLVNQRPARWLAADGCPRLLPDGAEPFRMSSYAKQHRTAGRPRVPR